MTQPTNARLGLAYVAVVLIWATTPLGIQWSGEQGGFLFGVTARMLIGALLALPVLWLLGQKLSFAPRALLAYAAGSLAIFVGMLGTYWAAQYLDSGMVSVLFGTAPLFTSLLAAWVLGERSLNAFWLGGLLLAFVGLGLIFHEQLNLQGIGGWAVLVMLWSAFIHGLSTVLVKKVNAPISGSVTSVGALWVAAMLYLLLWLTVTPMQGWWPTQIGVRAWGAIAYLAVFGSVFGFMLFFFALRHLSASLMGLITLLAPVLALWLGWWFEGEVLSRAALLGTALVLGGLAWAQWGEVLVRFGLRRLRKNKSLA
ncbi:MAG: DMT family transporter [Pseudomonadota bacterium]